MNDRGRILKEAIVARNQASDLLRALEEARTSFEPGPMGAASRDLYKRVTGSSSLEQAIATLKRTIETYDRVLGDVGVRTPAPTVPPAVSQRNGYGPWTLAARLAGRTA